MINYTYNADGVRIGKSGSRAGTFIVSGTQILREINSVATIDYLYDENGSPIGLTYKGKTYYYRKNLQGDIINITDSTGAKVVTYTYNAWGKLMSMTGNMELAVNNPFRYRGYYYDVESGLYYLNSRYYDPQTGRFINAEPNVDYGKFDEGAGLNGYNVFAYCANNPVMFKDDSGEFVISTAVLIGIGIGALIGGVAGGTYGYNKAVKNNVPKGQRWKYVVGYGLGGAVIGGVIGGFVGYGVGVALGAKASSGLVIKSVSKALSSVSRNTMHHIMQSKHAWGRLLRKATWNNVKGLINTTIKNGATTLINKQGEALIYEAVRNNVVVRYAIIDGVIKISDAWVKTR